MGLDGISINQLRVTQELNSPESNIALAANANDVKSVDGLSSGQRVDPDNHNKHGSDNNNEFGERRNDDEDTELNAEEIIKYDLSDSNKYLIKLSDDSGEILIIEKASGSIIQAIDADQLSKLVSYSTNSCGSIINKKFWGK